jgi:hypothetical protein
MYKNKYSTCNAWPRQQLVCINEEIYVISPAPNRAGLNLKTYPEDQVIEESKYIFLLSYYLLLLHNILFSNKNEGCVIMHAQGTSVQAWNKTSVH